MLDGPVDYEAELIQQIRQSRDLSLEAVAAATGVSFQSISRYEQGLHPVSARYLKALRHFTGDPRILAWFAPDLRHAEVMHAQAAAANATLLSRVTLALQSLAEATVEAEAIERDGRVDAADDPRIVRWTARALHAQSLIAEANLMLMAARESAERRAVARDGHKR